MGFVKETVIGQKKELSKEAKKTASEQLEKMRKDDEVLVKGIFKNIEAPGCEVMFSYRKYKEHPIQTYTLQDGETYEIPMGVAKHINRQCKYKRCAHLVGKDGKPMVGYGKPIQRYEFVSTDYM